MSRHTRTLRLLFVLTLGALATGQALAEELTDPMRPPGREVRATGSVQKAVPTRFRLDSVIISPNRRQAIINGKRMVPGDTIGGAKLIAIEASQVTLLVAGKRRVLTLLPLSIKMPSEATVQ